VLAGYLLGSWLLVEAVDWTTQASGLPAWTPALTLALVIAMSPLVVATAVIQGGLPGLRIEDEVDPNDLVGLTPDQVHVIPEDHPLYGMGLLTWRNMVLGGVSAAALLVTSVVAYMTMWALGIGPVGSLLAQGVVQEGDQVLMAPFVNHTDDASLADLVEAAFDLELSRSTVVSAARDGSGNARLVVSGDVWRRGSDYLIVSTVATPTGSVIVRFEEVASEDELLEASVQLTERIRERLGESLRTVREGERLAPMTTDSREALRLYRRASRAQASGDVAMAIALLSESVRVDPSFAMAWHRLGALAEESQAWPTAREAYQAVVDLWGPGGGAERTVQDLRVRIARLE
jgi:hypothetical protein